MVRNLGKEIAKRRREQQLTLRDVAAMVGLSRQAVVNAEHGDARLVHAAKIAKALGVSEEDVVSAATEDVRNLLREMD